MSLMTPKQLHMMLPVPDSIKEEIARFRHSISALICRQDLRMAMILGPCSLHHPDSAILYAKHLHSLQTHVENTSLLVMRAHVEKPRTCFGWRGMLYDPNLTGTEDLQQGIIASRTLLLQLACLHVPLACEFLDPFTAPFFSDLISWGFIGARTSTSPIHRHMASMLPMPIGFKNSLDSDWKAALHGSLVAQSSHLIPYIDHSGHLLAQTTPGNPHTHIVLRGGHQGTNYEANLVSSIFHQAKTSGLPHRILIDCAHGNSLDRYEQQIAPWTALFHDDHINHEILLGAMLESHIEEGRQSISTSADPYRSITDGCLSFTTTQHLVMKAHHALESSMIIGSTHS